MARQQHSPPDDHSPTPPAQTQHLTKRDVRRQRITDKLSSMINSFEANQQLHFTMQMRAVQVDMNLILRADLNAAASTGEDGALLEDGGEEIARMVEEVGVVNMDGEGAMGDYINLAGKRYREFAREVNDCVEERDAELVALHNNYYASITELDRLTQQKLHQADQEHHALSSTVRQRLISSLNKKRQQLLRDKEQLDIAADNPLLLHPNHFSINVPGSPSNGTANRKTRHLRHRAGSPAPGDLEANGGKRKRKLGALEDDGNESPAPGGYKPLGPPPDALGGGRSPFKDAREKNAYTQFEAPAYSLERIFTEKELAMASDAARMATYKHFNQPPEQQEKPSSTTNGTTAVPSIDGELLPDAPTAETEDAAATTETGTPPPPVSAPEMERSTSHQVLTRGTARANPLAALTELANVASASSRVDGKDHFAPVLPAHHAVMRSEKAGAPTPAGISALESEADLLMMSSLHGRNTTTNNGNSNNDTDGEDGDEENNPNVIRRKLIDQALATQGAVPPYRFALLETGPAHLGKGVERLAATGFAPVPTYIEQQQAKARAAGNGGVTSAAAMLGTVGEGVGGRGALAAALQGRFGNGGAGEPMSRTSSAGGGSEVEGLGGNGGGVTGVGTRGRGRGRLV